MKFYEKLNTALSEKLLHEMPLAGKYIYPYDEEDEEAQREKYAQSNNPRLRKYVDNMRRVDAVTRKTVENQETWDKLEKAFARSEFPINFIIKPEYVGGINQNKFIEFAEKHKDPNAINIPIAGNAAHRGDPVGITKMTPWMIAHQVGEALQQEIGPIFELFYDSPYSPHLSRMLKTKSGKVSRSKKYNADKADYVADLLWHGKIRRYKTAEEAWVDKEWEIMPFGYVVPGISTKEMHELYDKVEDLIRNTLKNSVGEILWGSQLEG
jgi:hypothetical protein